MQRSYTTTVDATAARPSTNDDSYATEGPNDEGVRSRSRPSIWPEACEPEIMDSMLGWKRITNSTPPQWAAAMLFAVGSAFAVCLSAQMVTRTGEWQVNPALGIAVIYGFLGLWLTFTWRIMRIGIYVSDTAVRIRATFRTPTASWSDIAAVDIAPASMSGSGVDAIWLRLTSGDHIETPVVRHSRWRNQQLPGDEFDNIVRLLRRRIPAGPNAPSA